MTDIAPILIVNTETSIPVRVKEQLRVYENGRSYLYIQAAANAQQRNQAGTYMIQLDAAGLETVQNIVAELLALPPQAEGAFPDGIRRTITVSQGEKSQSHLLPAQIVAATSPTLARITTWVSEFMTHIFSNPLAVVGLQAKVKAMPDKPPLLLLTCDSLGSETVSFLFRPESLAILAESGRGVVPVWQNSQRETASFIDGRGKLVDGVYTAAKLAPGQSATAVYSQTIPAIQPAMHIQVEGWIELYGEEGETAVTPQDPIWLVTQLTD
ncbi:MAG: hypothetical protein GWP17_05395 [Aquificales bacterium]|nr:hypothetical protein [Aquificales bacterium]